MDMTWTEIVERERDEDAGREMQGEGGRAGGREEERKRDLSIHRSRRLAQLARSAAGDMFVKEQDSLSPKP
jgi:hypothetical protein